jgi:hypothetical protein
MLPHPVAAMTHHGRWHAQNLRAEVARERLSELAAAAPREARYPWWRGARAVFRTGFGRVRVAVAPAATANR